MKAWSNGGKPVKSDQEAGWSVKTGSQGTKEYVYGFKLHLLIDCEYEMPIAAHVSAGNVHDVERASNVLSEARFTYQSFHPRYVMADKGYSSRTLIKLIQRQYSAEPVIQINSGHKKLIAEWAETMEMPEYIALARQRPAVERAFSRLKGQRCLNNITVCGLRKVTAHCYLSMIALQAMVAS